MISPASSIQYRHNKPDTYITSENISDNLLLGDTAKTSSPYKPTNWAAGFSTITIPVKPLAPSKLLTSIFSNTLFTNYKDASQTIKPILKTNSSSIVGALPSELNLNNTNDASFYIALNNLTDSIKSIQQLYTSPPKHILTLEDFKDYCQKKEQLAIKQFKKALINMKLASPEDDINFKTLNSGSMGLGYSFDINDKSYFIKVFKDKSDEDLLTNKYHSTLMEVNRALFLNDKFQNNPRFTKVYFANLQKGYYLAECVKNEEKPVKFDLPPESIYGLIYKDDNSGNIKSGKILDFGGIEIASKILADPKNEIERIAFKNFIDLPVNERIEYILKEKYPENIAFERILSDMLEIFSTKEKVLYAEKLNINTV